MTSKAGHSRRAIGWLLAWALFLGPGVLAEEHDHEEPDTGGLEPDHDGTDEPAEEDASAGEAATAPTPATQAWPVATARIEITARDRFDVKELRLAQNLSIIGIVFEVFRCESAPCDPQRLQAFQQLRFSVTGNESFGMTVILPTGTFERGAAYAFRAYGQEPDGSFWVFHKDGVAWLAIEPYEAGRLAGFLPGDLPVWGQIALIGSTLVMALALCVLLGISLMRPRSGRGPSAGRRRALRRRGTVYTAGAAHSLQNARPVAAAPAAVHALPQDDAWAEAPPGVAMRPVHHVEAAPRAGPLLSARSVQVAVIGRRSRKVQPGVPVVARSSGRVLADGVTGADGAVRLTLPRGEADGIEFVTDLPVDAGYINGIYLIPPRAPLLPRLTLEVAFERSILPGEEARIEVALTRAREALEPIAYFTRPVVDSLLSLFDARDVILQPTIWGLSLPGGARAVPEALEAFARATEAAATKLSQGLSSKALMNTLGRIDLGSEPARRLPPWTVESMLKQMSAGVGGADAVASRSRDIQEMLSRLGKGMDTRLFDSLHGVVLELVQAAREADDQFERGFLVVYALRLTEALKVLLQSERLREELRRIGPI